MLILLFLFRLLFSFSVLFFFFSHFTFFELLSFSKIKVLLKLILGERSLSNLIQPFKWIVLWGVFLNQRWIGQEMESYLIPRTSSPLNKWLMETLVNIHAALRTVKGNVKQLFRLQLQVNVNFTFSLPVTLFIFCSFFFLLFHLFWIVFLNSMARSSWN